MKLILNKDKITQIAIKILTEKLNRKKDKKSGLTESDIEMFNRIFNTPIKTEVRYQYHHYLDEEWQRTHKRFKSKIR